MQEMANAAKFSEKQISQKTHALEIVTMLPVKQFPIFFGPDYFSSAIYYDFH